MKFKYTVAKIIASLMVACHGAACCGATIGSSALMTRRTEFRCVWRGRLRPMLCDWARNMVIEDRTYLQCYY